MKRLNLITKFFKTETVLCISGFLSVISMFLVPPSADYLSYMDFRVLVLLFCLMAVVAGFNKTGVFQCMAQKLLQRTGNLRSLCFVLIMLCFIASMWVTNDVALITFVPFAILLLSITGQSNHLIFVIVMQTIAANLGSMLTPLGNPQNLYLYSYYNIPIKDFIIITLPVTVFSFLLLSASVFLVKNKPLVINSSDKNTPSYGGNSPPFHVFIYCSLFLVSLLSVLRLMDYRITLTIILIAILIIDRSILKKVDYSLLLTFVCFFLFVGNIGNIPVVRDYLADILKGKEQLVSALASQVISNVPAAILLSAFTDNAKALVLGTNIGGLGTLVASLASLISYKLYCRATGAKPFKYLGIFTLYNGIFLLLISIFLLL